MPIVPGGSGGSVALDSDLHIKQTIAFIEANPLDVEINRRVKQATPSGGWKWVAGADLDPITVRLVGSARVGATEQVITEDGRTVVPTLTLIAHPAQDVQVGDTFDHSGKEHEVVTIDNEHPPWRLSAGIVVHG